MYDKTKKRPLFYPGRPNDLTSPSSQIYRNAYLGLSDLILFFQLDTSKALQK